ncbi:MerR family transcriptional regulator [Granulicoccus sp. GXG6511]|uniref:MerR family transcriptional regulator n=1 Tax=Granulicoccus sp. GXG6511 TaxID=3381351 RepID=UPI003D7D4265
MPDAADTTPDDGWGLDDFLDEVAESLTRLGIAATAPDRRTVRYYATLGVVDRPAMAGREARYGRRQLAQLLALKRLQAEGVRLGAIGPRIAGVATEELMALAAGSPPASGPRPQPDPAPAEPPTLRTQSVLRLAPGVDLVLAMTVSDTEAAAILRAAGSLLTRISALGLTPDHDPTSAADPRPTKE